MSFYQNPECLHIHVHIVHRLSVSFGGKHLQPFPATKTSCTEWTVSQICLRESVHWILRESESRLNCNFTNTSRMIVLRAAKSQYCIYFLSRCFALLSFYSDTIWWSTCYNTRFWTLCPALPRPAVMARGHGRVSGFSLMPKVPHIRLSCLHSFTEERVMAIPNAFQRQWFQANKLFSSQFLKQTFYQTPRILGVILLNFPDAAV